MIKSLHISNYAIIDQIDLDFQSGLTIITGETGAGKSILLGALGLILGKRADTTVLYNDTKKCIVEAQFDIEAYNLKAFFEESELDYDNYCIIRREINAQGKSRAFINDTPTTLSNLRRLSDNLIDLHQQFDILEINEENFQTEILDALIKNPSLLNDYRENYSKYLKAKSKLASLKEEQRKAAQEQDFLAFQLEELEELDLQSGDLSMLELELNRIKSSEDIILFGNAVNDVIEERETSVSSILLDLIKMSESLVKVDSRVSELNQRLISSREELNDLAKSAISLAEDADIDPQRMQELEDRVNEINRLLNKHHLTTDEELISLTEKIATRLAAYKSLDKQIEELERELNNSKIKLRKLGQEISQERKTTASLLSQKVTEILRNLSMENAQLTVEFTLANDFKKSGIDDIQFLFTANKGGKPLPLSKVASGGELSRLNLAIKSLVAEAMTLPTLIFDEIDTGVSGSVALKMGVLLESVSKKHQTIVITHSPQVASRADHHFFIYKEDTSARTITHMKKLSPQERQIEIAKMLSSDPPSTEALENAAQLLAK